MTTVKINEKEYEISPLKIKHLRRISDVLIETRNEAGLFKSIERWIPFIFESIKARNPKFTEEEMAEATLDEVSQAWDNLVKISGIKLIAGEPQPTKESIGSLSTGASVPPSAGRSIN